VSNFTAYFELHINAIASEVKSEFSGMGKAFAAFKE
jgi:hypothetical protein